MFTTQLEATNSLAFSSTPSASIYRQRSQEKPLLGMASTLMTLLGHFSLTLGHSDNTRCQSTTYLLCWPAMPRQPSLCCFALPCQPASLVIFSLCLARLCHATAPCLASPAAVSVQPCRRVSRLYQAWPASARHVTL